MIFLSFFRTTQEEEGAGSSVEEEVQEKLGLLGVREEGSLLDPQDGEEAVVLLVRHPPRLAQYLLGGG